MLPYPDPDARWPEERRAVFARLCESASEVQTLQRKPPEGKQQAAAAMARRDAWFAQNVNEAILIWDQEDGRLAKLAKTLEQRLGDDVWYLSP